MPAASLPVLERALKDSKSGKSVIHVPLLQSLGGGTDTTIPSQRLALKAYLYFHRHPLFLQRLGAPAAGRTADSSSSCSPCFTNVISSRAQGERALSFPQGTQETDSALLAGPPNGQPAWLDCCRPLPGRLYLYLERDIASSFRPCHLLILDMLMSSTSQYKIEHLRAKYRSHLRLL